MSDIAVHPDSTRPRKAWEKLKVKQTVKSAQATQPDSPVPANHVRFVCLSDTHGRIEKHPELVPNGDVLLHAGDITNVGKAFEVDKFNMFLGNLPHRFKVVIAGNHDMTFDDGMMRTSREALEGRFGLSTKSVETYLNERNMGSVKELLTNCIYLEDSMTEVYGIKIYGSPWQPEFCDWGFNLPRGQPCLDKWNLIPEDTDVLITHGPPIGHGDRCHDGYRAGCVELLSTIQRRVRPKVHVFGHIHEGYGMTSDGVTTYINASTCNLRYQPRNPPIVFDLPLPDGVTKDPPSS